MSDVLSVAFRPKTFSGMIGQEAELDVIRAQVASGRTPKAWLLMGETGSGKTTLARILALSYASGLGAFGEPGPDLWERFNEFGIRQINASDKNGVDDIRSLIEVSQYVPVSPSVCRVLILDEAHKLTDAAQNALLAATEESTHTVWILATTTPHKIIKTLKSRLYPIELRPLASEGIKTLIRNAGKAAGFKGDLAPYYADVKASGIGSPRQILMGLERYMNGGKKTIAADEDGVVIIEFCRAFVKQDVRAVCSMLKAATPEEMKNMRIALASYLKAILLNGAYQDSFLTASIKAISGPVPYEDPVASAWFVACCLDILRNR